jgi:hypothetical protein
VVAQDRGRGGPDPAREVRRQVAPGDPADAVGPEELVHGEEGYPLSSASLVIANGSEDNGSVDRIGSGSLALVYTTPSITDGYLARGRLEAEGIPVMVKGEGEGPYRMGPVHLYVPAELEVQALLLIDEMRSGRLEVDPDEDLLGETDWLEAETEAEPFLDF